MKQQVRELEGKILDQASALRGAQAVIMDLRVSSRLDCKTQLFLLRI
jgi:hypothetical protein